MGVITLPSPSQDYSTALFASNGQLLNARLAKDEQWRFQPVENIPKKYETALVLFEDQYFYRHPGINLISLWRALRQNIKAGKIVNGGSTISMQNIRLRRSFKKSRSLFNKTLEIYWAIALEVKYSKKKILLDYISRAPFGTNVVGLEAACWRYFDKPSHLLSWAEAACLAILPNSPSLIHPGKNRTQLKVKRDRLLYRLYQKQHIDSITLHLAVQEPLPDRPKVLPNHAPHTLDYLNNQHLINGNYHSSLDYNLQVHLNDFANWSYQNLAQNQIHNLAILVADTKTGATLAYIGNPSLSIQSTHVDHVQAPRSTGSILKPFLYAGAIDNSKILSSTLLQDLPIVIDGFQPRNFSKQFYGVIPADEALIQSLNIPFVLLLQQYGLEQFHHNLRKLGLNHLNKPPLHYGLSLILGGGEASLWEIVGSYAYLGRTLSRYAELNHHYDPGDLHPLTMQMEEKTIKQNNHQRDPIAYSAGSIYQTLEALKKLQRPDDLGQWQSFVTHQPLAWKTGTSYGFRDAWAIGVNSQYTVGVWVGNSSGEARPSLLGIKTAAPLLFEVVSRLPQPKGPVWFEPPLDEMNIIATCRASGMKSNPYCPIVDTTYQVRHQDYTLPCTYHISILTDRHTGLRIHQDCTDANQLIQKTVFQLSPLQEYFYAVRHPEYEKTPSWDPNCETTTKSNASMSMIHPEPNSAMYLPRDQSGQPGKIVFKLAHRDRDIPIFWHLDDAYIATTKTFHELAITPTIGPHLITVIDSVGTELKCPFTILNRNQ